MNKDLIEKSKKGNKEAFTELILSINNDLYKIAKARLNNDADIDDAIQETMISAFKSIKKLKNNDFFKTWIIKILINKCNLIYNENKKHDKVIEKDKVEFEINGTNSEEIESNIDFYILIECLNYEERIVLILYYVYEYTTKAISKILKISESSVKSRLVRGREKIKNSLKGGKKYE